MRKVYIKSNSITELQQKFKNNEKIIGTEYNLFNPDGYKTYHCIYSLNPEDIIALYKDENNIQPFKWINVENLF